MSKLCHKLYYILNSGWVQTVYIYVIPGTTNCILKAKVKPSQRLHNEPHEDWVGIVKSEGDVFCGHSSCVAG